MTDALPHNTACYSWSTSNAHANLKDLTDQHTAWWQYFSFNWFKRPQTDCCQSPRPPLIHSFFIPYNNWVMRSVGEWGSVSLARGCTRTPMMPSYVPCARLALQWAQWSSSWRSKTKSSWGQQHVYTGHAADRWWQSHESVWPSLGSWQRRPYNGGPLPNRHTVTSLRTLYLQWNLAGFKQLRVVAFWCIPSQKKRSRHARVARLNCDEIRTLDQCEDDKRCKMIRCTWLHGE